MGHSTCCVVNCKNTGVNSQCKFYQFPTAKYKVEQRRKWIAAIRRKNPDGSPWCPKPWDLICSAHFVGNKKSEEQTSPSYIPTIFPPAYKAKVVNETAAMTRHDRFMKRRSDNLKQISTKQQQQVVEESMELHRDNEDSGEIQCNDDRRTCDQECQADIFYLNDIQPEKTFICNRYINNATSCSDAEIQTEITIPRIITVPNKKQFKDKQCGTPQKLFVDQSVGTNIEDVELTATRSVAGITSIKNNEQLVDLAGVTFEHFQFLLRRVNDAAENCAISKENRLLIFFIKIRKMHMQLFNI